MPHRSLGIVVLSPLLGARLGKGVVVGTLGTELGGRGEERCTLDTVGVRERGSVRAEGIVGVRDNSELETVVAGNDDDGASLLLSSSDVVSSRLVVNGEGLGDSDGIDEGSGASSAGKLGDEVTMLGTCVGVFSLGVRSVSKLSSLSSDGSDGNLVDGAFGVGASSSSTDSGSSMDTCTPVSSFIISLDVSLGISSISDGQTLAVAKSVALCSLGAAVSYSLGMVGKDLNDAVDGDDSGVA